MGDLIYALPAIRALARVHGPVDLVTSPLCSQLVPILWEQSYIKSVEMDTTRAYWADRKILQGWDYFSETGDGINLSPQPEYTEPGSPQYWTHCYEKKAGVPLTPADYVALPSLVNHRRWLWGYDVRLDGKPTWPDPMVVVAPEAETCPESPPTLWQRIITEFAKADYRVIVVGKRRWDFEYTDCVDLRGVTTVPTMAYLIAQAHAFLGQLSLPYHLARHCEMPHACLQQILLGLVRSIPQDTVAHFFDPDEWRKATDFLIDWARREAPGREE